MASARLLLRPLAFLLVVALATTVLVAADRPSDPLLQLLEKKGILTSAEVSQIDSAPPAEQKSRLEQLLRDKGVISAAEFNQLHPDTREVPGGGVSSSLKGSAPSPTPAAAPPPPIIPAIAPIRVLQTEPAKSGGLIPDIKLGSGANLKIYGFIKASAIYDSSSPLGTDMPLPGFLTDTGPDSSGEFHVKARFARVGANFEWPDVSKNLAITGKLEFDFEGNFTRVLNRNISTVRSSQPSIRLAWGRLDYKWSDTDSVFLLIGQDWTPFGSSTLPNIYETTGLGLGFGSLYERAPQFRFGWGHQFTEGRKFRIQPEFAIVLPAYGNTSGNAQTGGLQDQTQYGERQGADSERPEIQARMVFQFQLDKAPGVVPAQIIVSGVYGKRKGIILRSAVPVCPHVDCGGLLVDDDNFFRTSFPQGAEVESTRNGWTGEVQLPTRFVTFIAKYWRGKDLRFYFVGNLLSTFNDSRGLLAGSTGTGSFIDGSGSAVFGLDPTTLEAVVAPQRPFHSQGGFVNLGFPLSRIFGANPEGRNAGWQLFLHYAYDQVNTQEARLNFIPNGTLACPAGRACNRPQKNDLAAVTLFYRLNKFVTFALEESYYRTRAVGDARLFNAAGTLLDPLGTPRPNPNWQGVPARSWHNLRTEFGPIFTF